MLFIPQILASILRYLPDTRQVLASMSILNTREYSWTMTSTRLWILVSVRVWGSEISRVLVLASIYLLRTLAVAHQSPQNYQISDKNRCGNSWESNLMDKLKQTWLSPHKLRLREPLKAAKQMVQWLSRYGSRTVFWKLGSLLGRVWPAAPSHVQSAVSVPGCRQHRELACNLLKLNNFPKLS